jgi:hypothetical protein
MCVVRRRRRRAVIVFAGIVMRNISRRNGDYMFAIKILFPEKLIKDIDRLLADRREWYDRSDFVRGATARYIRELDGGGKNGKRVS